MTLRNQLLNSGTPQVTLITNPDLALGLIEKTRGIGQRDPEALSKLRFYLSTIGQRWAPRIVVVSQDGAIIGFACLKEKTLGSLNTGVFFAEANGSSFLVAEKVHFHSVAAAAFDFLFDKRKIRGLRLFVSPESEEIDIVREMAADRHLSFSLVENRTYHTELPLAESYDAFRREVISGRLKENLNRYRNRAARERHVFHTSIPFEEFNAAAVAMVRDHRVRNKLVSIQRGLRMVSQASSPILMGLRHANGQEWLSLAFGWRSEGRAWLYGQLNREFDFPKNSLCIVTTGHIVEHLIEEGKTKTLAFWGGRAGHMERACHPLPNSLVFLDTPTFRVQASFISKVLLAAAPILSVEMQRSVRHSVRGILRPPLPATNAVSQTRADLA